MATRVVVAAKSPLCFVPTPNSAFKSPRGFEKCAVNTASVDVAGGNFIEHVVDAFVIPTLAVQCWTPLISIHPPITLGDDALPATGSLTVFVTFSITVSRVLKKNIAPNASAMTTETPTIVFCCMLYFLVLLLIRRPFPFFLVLLFLLFRYLLDILGILFRLREVFIFET